MFPRRLRSVACLLFCLPLFAVAAQAQPLDDVSDVAPVWSGTIDDFYADVVGDGPDWCAVQLPREVRAWYRNPDGSCVQCSNGMIGIWVHCDPMAALLWSTEFGPAVRGGSNPDRVARYCNSRGIKVWNVTGESTFAWMAWSCRNGRGSAIGAGTKHFQTLVGHNPRSGQWAVCNNNSTNRIDVYSDAGFRRLHLASGRWCVVPDYSPGIVPPVYARYWPR